MAARSFVPEFPVLSFKERDRRFALARKFMDDNGYDAMVVMEGGNRVFRHWTVNQFYFSNEPDGQAPIVIIPRDSDPVMFTIRPHFGLIMGEAEEGLPGWIEDVRLSEPEPATCVSDFFAERGLERAKVGLIGTSANNAWPYAIGSLDDPVWNFIKTKLPNVTATDVAAQFTLLALPRSEEELALARAAGRACEEAGKMMLEVAKVGVSEIELYAASREAMAIAGIDEHYSIFSIGKELRGLHLPRWTFPKRPPRKVEAGDVAMFEMFPVYGGVDLQLQIGIHFGEPSDKILHMAKVGRAAYDAGNAALKPGVTFKEVWEPMMDIIVDAGCWSWGPGIHSLPMPLMGPIQAGLEGQKDLPKEFSNLTVWDWGDRSPVDDVVMQEGMLFANEPGIGMDRLRVYQGSCVVCGAEGAEELTTVGADFHIVD